MAPRHVVVVGAGLAGGATAWHLARRGVRVTVLERDRPAGAGGSSHGSSRIFRYAYPDPVYAELVRRAAGDWDELEETAGLPLRARQGSVDHGADRDVPGLSEVLTGLGVRNEVLPPEEAARRWPHMVFTGPVLWQPDAGVVDSQGAAEAMVRLAVEAGADLRTRTEAVRVRRDGAGVAVDVAAAPDANGPRHAPEETISADHVVVAAGGRLPLLLRDLPLPAGFLARLPAFEVRKEQVFHFPWRDPGAAWPTFIHGEPGMLTYGLPGGRDAGFAGQKVAEFNGGPVIGSAADSDGLIDPANRARVTAYVRRFLPGLVPEPYAEATCLFTNTPTEDFVIDGVDGVTILSACSGHGAKFAPLLGRITADDVLGVDPVPALFRPASA